METQFHSTRTTFHAGLGLNIWFTLNPVKSETPSLDMILNKSSIMDRVWFALLTFFLSNFQLCTLGCTLDTVHFKLYFFS